MKKTLAIALVLVMALTFGACGTSGNTGDKPVLRVGMECNYAPFNWTQMDESNGAVPISSGGYAGGYDVEIAKLLADALDRELVIVKTEWEGLIPALNSGKIDVVIAGMSPTAERAESVDFSEPYYESELVIVVRKDGPYASATSLADFAGAKITAQLSTFHYTVIDQITGVNKQTAMETFPAMIVALKSGKIDGYISERPGAVSAMAANPELTFVEFAEGKGFETSKEDVAISVAVKKGSSELLASINEALKNISREDREAMMNAAVENQPVNEE
ncbi:MAG: transporter substrate-binding domain-containing protein [Christensenellales bacterium]|jgi:putative lysine transport system substrate-binding protein